MSFTACILQWYLTVKYRPGRNNQNADALSRQYLERFSFGTAVPALGARAERCQPVVMEGHCEEVTALPGRRPKTSRAYRRLTLSLGPSPATTREGGCCVLKSASYCLRPAIFCSISGTAWWSGRGCTTVSFKP